MNARAALINQLRGVLFERRIILPKGHFNLMPRLLRNLRDEWFCLDVRIKVYADEPATMTREDEQARRLATVLVSALSMRPR